MRIITSTSAAARLEAAREFLTGHPPATELVIVGARVSKSGNALPQSGDLVGQSAPVKAGGGKLMLVIDGVQP